jgi:hypothetical protein
MMTPIRITELARKARDPVRADHEAIHNWLEGSKLSETARYVAQWMNLVHMHTLEEAETAALTALMHRLDEISRDESIHVLKYLTKKFQRSVTASITLMSQFDALGKTYANASNHATGTNNPRTSKR